MGFFCNSVGTNSFVEEAVRNLQKHKTSGPRETHNHKEMHQSETLYFLTFVLNFSTSSREAVLISTVSDSVCTNSASNANQIH